MVCEQHDALNDDSGDAQSLNPGLGAPKRHGIFRHRWQSDGDLGQQWMEGSSIGEGSYPQQMHT